MTTLTFDCNTCVLCGVDRFWIQTHRGRIGRDREEMPLAWRKGKRAPISSTRVW